MGTVVYYYLMILCVDRLFDIWLVESLAIDDQVVLVFLDPHLFVFVEELIVRVGLETLVLGIIRRLPQVPILGFCLELVITLRLQVLLDEDRPILLDLEVFKGG